MSSLSSVFCLLLAIFAILSVDARYFTASQADRYLLPSYDYIIVGAGPAGLTVADRLTTDPSVTVLVLEAGYLDNDRTLKPPNGYLAVPGTVGNADRRMFNWNMSTIHQTSLYNRTVSIPQGRAIGGGTWINGMVWTRGAITDYSVWAALGNPDWSWDGLLKYFKRSEFFTNTASPHWQDKLHIHPCNETHSADVNSTSVYVSYPRYFYNQSENIMNGFVELGIPINPDPNTGFASGAYVVPSSIHPTKQERSDAREAHFNRIYNRTNIHIVSLMRVSRLKMDRSNEASGYRRVRGVEFSSSENGTLRCAAANKEVILAAGAIWTPTLLQLSGIGPQAELKKRNISVEIDLPGVGYNLQDHPEVRGVYNYQNDSVFTPYDLTGDVLAEVIDEYVHHRTGPWTSPMVSLVAFPTMRMLVSNAIEWINALFAPSPNELPDGTPTSVRLGYEAQKNLVRTQLFSSDVGILEIMASTTGILTVSAQKTLSRGTVRPPASKSVWDLPQLDFRYCSHSLDCEVLVLALQTNNRLIKTNAMKDLQAVPTAEFDTNDHDALMRVVKSHLGTEQHPCCTAAMMPLELGGVVDPELKVYGTSNLRVVDASIMPVIPAAHLQAVVYAIAEKAADLIKAGGTYPARNQTTNSTRPWRKGA